jgi:hypothetical protein
LKSIRIAADRARAAEVAREKEAAREAEVAVNSTVEKHAADITARTSGGSDPALYDGATVKVGRRTLLAGLQASGQNPFQIVFQLVDENDPGRLPPGEDERRRWPPTRSRLVLAPSGLLFCVLYDGYDGTDTQDEIIVLDAQTPPRPDAAASLATGSGCRCSMTRVGWHCSCDRDNDCIQV